MQKNIELTPNHIYIILATILIGFLVYRIFKIRRENHLAEAFESSINKLMRNKKKNTNNSNSNSNSKSNSNRKMNNDKPKKSRLTFDDLIKESENMNVEKYTITNMKKNFYDYINSFKRANFNNVTGTADETYEQLGMFKDKFFEIFT